MEKERYTDLRSKIIAIAEEKLIDRSIIERKAYAEAAFFLMNRVIIGEEDIFAGNFERCDISTMYPRSMEEEISGIVSRLNGQTQEYESMVQAEAIGLFTRSPGAHVVPAYEELLQEGIGKRIRRVQQYILNCEECIKKQFYVAEYVVLRAMQERVLKYAKEAGRLYVTSKKKELKRIRISCERIANDPPQNLHEAIQLVILIHESILAESGSGSISFGRLDQYLYPFYKKDISTAKISEENAQEMITALWRKIAQYEMGWQNVTLGGSNKKGDDQCNELTIMCMNASLIVRSDQPQVSLRVHRCMPKYVWEKAFELIQTGMGFPELYNDEVAVKAKRSAGILEEDAWNYSIVGCVELSAGGKEYSHTEGARFNWQKILELMLNEGQCLISGKKYSLAEKHNLEEILSFEEFYDWYKRELVEFTKQICNCIDILSWQYARCWPVPFLSSVMQGCIEKGRDVTDSGTLYNNLTVDCVGIASVADSLEAIETLVFREKIISLKELADILRNNFVGYESIRRKMLDCPKYGNDIESVDKKIKDLTKIFVDTLSGIPVKYRQGRFQAGFYTSYFHGTMGELTGASPDGRGACEALSSSLSPMAGMDRKGPTAVINSANCIDMEKFGNGMVLDLKFTSEFLRTENHRQAVKILIEEYFEKGGLEIQFNTLDRETLIEAQKNPMKYRDLIVRVSGFSAFFVTLEETLQNEIIKRTEHQIA